MDAEPTASEARPQPLRSYHQLSCNEPIPLYSGPGHVVFGPDGRLRAETVEAFVSWLPLPRLAIEASFAVAYIEWAPDPVTIELPVGRSQRNGFPLSFQARMVATTGRTESQNIQVEFVATEPLVFGVPPTAHASWVQVHLVNGLDFAGREVTYDGRTTSAGRFTIRNAAWTAVLDPVPGVQGVLQEAMLRSGYSVTHIARLTVNGQLCSAESATACAAELADFLSMVTGSHVGAFLITGFDSADREIWTVWRAQNMEAYQGNHSPLPRAYLNQEGQFGPPDLSAMSEKFVRLRSHPDSAVVLARLGSWYRGGLSADAGTAAMFVGAGLELLTYWYLVADQGLSAVGFERLSPADRLRLLLASCDVPLTIPATLPGLAGLTARQAKSGRAVDGAWCVTEFRNGVIHPPTKPRTYVQDPALQFEATWLGLWYLDLAVLRLLGHEGGYRNRIDAQQAAYGVPWSRTESHGPLKSWLD